MLVALMGFGLRLFSIVRFESIIHEFDPWFNYRATMYLVKHGWYEFLNWFDETAWYPLGRDVGGTVYPGIMVTSAVFHHVLNRILAFPVSIRDICVFLAPAFSGLTAYATYLFARELKDPAAGLLAASLMAICPGYISRSVAGSYDNEAIAIFLMMATFYLWLRASKTGSPLYGTACALSYYYMVSAWGGYAFVINMIPLHVLTLLCMGRYTHRLYTSYSTFYVVGTLASMTVPFVGFQPTYTSEHMAALGVFGLLQLTAFSQIVRGLVDSEQFRLLLKVSVALLALGGCGVLAGMSAMGVISPWGGRFYSLWDTGYAAKHIPIIASVSEHQPTTWSAMYMDFQWLFYLLPAGVFYCLRWRRNEHIFAVLFAVTAAYFASVMVRLMLALAPITCVAAGVAISSLMDAVLRPNRVASTQTLVDAQNESEDLASTGQSAAKGPERRDSREDSRASPATDGSSNKRKQRAYDLITKALVIAPLLYHLIHYVHHAVWVTQMAYSSPSVIISSRNNQTGKTQIVDDFREAYYWIRRNTARDARILAWWDYGYQIAGMADRTTIVDNNTWNYRHIATVGKALASSEPTAYKTMRQLGANYVLVIAGTVTGYAGDDINKLLWMIRIAAGVFPDEIREKDYMNPSGAFSIDAAAPARLRESLLYKMIYRGMSELGGPKITDNVRGTPIGDPNPKLSVLEEVFTSERFLVRVYRVKSPDVLGRPLRQAASFQ